MELLARDLRSAPASVLSGVLALNRAEEIATSPLGASGLGALIRTSFATEALVADDGAVAAFLLAFDPGAAYDSPNFLWFRARSTDFVYVDRIVVAAGWRGRGLARGLYRRLIARAAAAGFAQVVCEVNLDPPNPGSDAFHAALGFREVGRGSPAPGRTVRYLARPLLPAEAGRSAPVGPPVVGRMP
jgi:hypothetical protein